jgi:hypothetical protein
VGALATVSAFDPKADLRSILVIGGTYDFVNIATRQGSAPTGKKSLPFLNWSADTRISLVTDTNAMISSPEPKLYRSVLNLEERRETECDLIALVVSAEKIDDLKEPKKSRTLMWMTDEDGLGFKITLFSDKRGLADELVPELVYRVSFLRIVVWEETLGFQATKLSRVFPIRDPAVVEKYKVARTREDEMERLHYYQHWPLDSSDGHEMTYLVDRARTSEGRKGVIGVDVVFVKVVPFNVTTPMVRQRCSDPDHSRCKIERNGRDYVCIQMGGSSVRHSVKPSEIRFGWSFAILATSEIGNLRFRVVDDFIGNAIFGIDADDYEAREPPKQGLADVAATFRILLRPFRCYVWVSDASGQVICYLKLCYPLSGDTSVTRYASFLTHEESEPAENDAITKLPLPLGLEDIRNAQKTPSK